MMLKKGIVLIMLSLIFSSCDLIYYGKIAIQDNIRRIEMEREEKSVMKKTDLQQLMLINIRRE